jgi:hypothetical protein
MRMDFMTSHRLARLRIALERVNQKTVAAVATALWAVQPE